MAEKIDGAGNPAFISGGVADNGWRDVAADALREGEIDKVFDLLLEHEAARVIVAARKVKVEQAFMVGQTVRCNRDPGRDRGFIESARAIRGAAPANFIGLIMEISTGHGTCARVRRPDHAYPVNTTTTHR